MANTATGKGLLGIPQLGYVDDRMNNQRVK